MDATVLIATYNRATLLEETLRSLAGLRVAPGFTWDVIIVDNNSRDDTREVVERHVPGFPVRLQYLFEGQQGRSSALNAGIDRAEGRILAFTDDDVRVAPGWLAAACGPLSDVGSAVAYTGGPVRPLWEIPPPRWLDLSRGDLWGTIAIQDHGATPFVYEERRKVPLGANMAARSELFERVGGFRADLGRTGGRLVLGQEVPELLMRARNAGLRGSYVPAMEVHHHIPAQRLTRRYFRRWWFGKGVSRAALERMQPVTELGVDLRQTSHLLGVPRYMYGTLLRDGVGMLREGMKGRPEQAFRHQMMTAFFAGYFWARVRERRAGLPPAQHSDKDGGAAQRTTKVVSTGR